jgi:hypothetical protein
MGCQEQQFGPKDENIATELTEITKSLFSKQARSTGRFSKLFSVRFVA